MLDRAKKKGRDSSSAGDARFEDLREPYGAQVAPASKIRMLECVSCKKTFFDFEGRNPQKPPGNHYKCGKELRWVWVE